MRRTIEDELVSWKTGRRRKPLIVRGARQVGKTYSIEEFGRAHFDNVVVVNFEESSGLSRLFEGSLSADHIIQRLELFLDTRIVPGESLLFFDEVQACPRAIVALRYLYEQAPELHVIAAGSLLEFSLGHISFPVGRVQFLDMYPMTFVEFLWALGRVQLAELVSAEPEPIHDVLHDKLLDLVRQYFFVGGMPESVDAFRETGSFHESFAVHRELCHTYRQDFSKYAPRADPRCLDTVFENVARHVGSQVKYTHLDRHHSIPTVHKAFDLLCRARVVTRVAATDPSGLPLGAGVNPRRFKALLVDIGLCHHLCGLDAQAALKHDDLLSINRGALAEQFVGQELLAAGGGDLFYWARSRRGSTAEVDYLAVIGGAIVPIEVKRGPAGKLKSLHLVLSSYPNLERGVVLSSAPYAVMVGQRLTFAPLYLARAIRLQRSVANAP